MPYVPNALAEEYNEFRQQVESRFTPAARALLHDPERIAAAKAARKERRRQVREAIAEAQKASVLSARIAGMTHQEIHARFGIGKQRQQRLLADAERDGLIQTAKDILVSRLVPKALLTYDHHLESNSLEAARDVMKGLQLLQEKPQASPLAPGEAEVTLREIRARYTKENP